MARLSSAGDLKIDEDENIPVLGLCGSATQPSSEMKPHQPDNCVFATPTAERSKCGVRAKPQIPITPLVNMLNFGAKYQSPESRKRMNTYFPRASFVEQYQQLLFDHKEQDIHLEVLKEMDMMTDSMLDMTADSPNSSSSPPDIQPATPVAARNPVDEPQEVVLNVNPESDLVPAESLKAETISSDTNVTLNNSSVLKPSLDGTRDISGEDSSISSRPSSRLDGTVELGLQVSSKAELSTSSEAHASAQTSSPQNTTVDLSPPEKINKTDDQPLTSSADTIEAETADSASGDCSAAEAGGSGVVKNGTFNLHSQSSGTTILGEHTNATIGLQNTIDVASVSKSNTTRTVTEESSSVSCQNVMDAPSPPRLSNASIHSQSNAELRPDEERQVGETAAGEGTNITRVDPHDGQCEEAPTSGSDTGEAEAQSPSAGLPETSDHQCPDTGSDKSNPFNLDDTLDLRADALITSTPMTDFKVLNLVRQEEGKILAAQKKLYGEGGGGGPPAEPPSNIVGDRKTFLPAAVKSLLPPPKAQLWKRKLAPENLERPAPVTSRLRMTKARANMETSTNTSAAMEETTGIPSSCVGRTMQTRSKQPSGLRRPQLSGIPSATQRATTGLRLPSTRGTLPPPSSSGVDKPSAPAAANPTTKTTQTNKPLRTKTSHLAKKMKLDLSLPPSSGEAPSSSSEPACKVKSMKPPTIGQRGAQTKSRSQVSGCAHCVVLEQQLKVKCEEIRRLKEMLKDSPHAV